MDAIKIEDPPEMNELPKLSEPPKIAAPIGKRWSEGEIAKLTGIVNKLLQIKTVNPAKKLSKSQSWGLVAGQLQGSGYLRSWEACRKAYRRVSSVPECEGDDENVGDDSIEAEEDFMHTARPKRILAQFSRDDRDCEAQNDPSAKKSLVSSFGTSQQGADINQNIGIRHFTPNARLLSATVPGTSTTSPALAIPSQYAQSPINMAKGQMQTFDHEIRELKPPKRA